MNNNPDKNAAQIGLEKLRKRLVDLTARNRLINFKHTKRSCLRVIDELPDQLIERLLADNEMRFKAVPEPKKNQLINAGVLKIDKNTGKEIKLKKEPTAEEWARYIGLEPSYQVPLPNENDSKRKHSDQYIQTLLFPYELESMLRKLRQKAELVIEESGTNILYFAFGFLEWHESRDSNISHLAPLVLVPLRLRKGKLNQQTQTYEYTLNYSGEDIIPNISLREKLRIDFGLALPALDEDILPETYFKRVLELVRRNKPHWKVRRYITLCLLNFSKLLMYLDLDPNQWPSGKSIINHRVVSKFLSGYESQDNNANHSQQVFFEKEHPIDDIDGIHDKYPLIDDADSSQHSALIDAIDGKDMVIEGPPGTGKSQTITNLIAAALSRGKKILFVSEKLAALEVVKRRLDAAGLGEFCLELHSNKSQKRKVLDEIEKRLKRKGGFRHPDDIETDIDHFEKLKHTLRHHAERINKKWQNTGKTIHGIFMSATRYRQAIGGRADRFHPNGYNGLNYDVNTHKKIEDQILAFIEVCKPIEKNTENINKIQQHPWYGVQNSNIQAFESESVRQSLQLWQNSLLDLEKLTKKIAQVIGVEQSQGLHSLSALKKLVSEIEKLPALHGDELLDTVPILKGQILDKTKSYFELFKKLQQKYNSLSKEICPDLFTDSSALSRLQKSINILSNIVSDNVSLGRIIYARKQLVQIDKQLASMHRNISYIHNKVEDSTSAQMNFTFNGLKELRLFIKTVSELPPEYAKYRDTLFDNDELDQQLPEIRKTLEQLLQQKKCLSIYFNFQQLPDSNSLTLLYQDVIYAGPIPWLKPSWWKARKTWLRYCPNPRIKFKELVAHLPQLMSFLSQLYKFSKNSEYRALLGTHIKGLETNLNMIESLRQWYRSVRQTYGVGFGPKVKIGDAILTLSTDTIKGIRSLTEHSFVDSLDKLLAHLAEISYLFTHSSELKNGKMQLPGKNGLLKKYISFLEQIIANCQLLTRDENTTVSDLKRRLDDLINMHRSGLIWMRADLDKRLFGGRLGLKNPFQHYSETALSSAENTLRLAGIVDKDIEISFIKNLIYSRPEKKTFQILNQVAKHLRSHLKHHCKVFDQFKAKVSLDQNAWTQPCRDNLSQLIKRNSRALDSPHALQNWLDYVREHQKLIKIGFSALAADFAKGNIPTYRIRDAAYAGIYDLLARTILKQQPELGRFSGRSHKAMQQQFINYDHRLKKLQCEKIAWNLDQIPVSPGRRGTYVREHTDLVLLEHECSKKKRHISIRKLVERACNALVALKPCFMMSPLSVAQYLSPGQLEFDMVVMDEASQIKPEDALGAIARARQIVIVGDPKQLPPTSFFDRLGDGDDDDQEDSMAITESESILEATQPIFTSRRLRWHYRSQHESLIAFSNHFFYDGDLVVFPSPNSNSSEFGLSFNRVRRGTFVNRRNTEEARLISLAVRNHFLNNFEEKLGVACMNVEQRDQIDRAIEALAKEDFAFRDALERDQSRLESLFIKNLENVQGDERDVIIISMTYGPQEPGGKVFQRFGPINSEMGWRRLNVLFTRSRKRMLIYSSMGADDILTGPSSRRGVRALKDFLSYAETGILPDNTVTSNRGPESDFEIAVAKALGRAGFECIAQVGVAGYFIDIAVKDPGNPGRYLMGIECDGATYHSAKSVRDRDRLRQTILERYGWRIRRIWSTDWFKNPQGELSTIIEELNDLKTKRPISHHSKKTDKTREEMRIADEKESYVPKLDEFLARTMPLDKKLEEFERQVIRKALPQTPENERLLRPSMIEALCQYMPVNKPEFYEVIPSYLRQPIEQKEYRYLEPVLELVNSFAEEVKRVLAG